MLLCVALVAAMGAAAYAIDPAPDPQTIINNNPPANATDATVDSYTASEFVNNATLQGTWASAIAEIKPIVEAWEKVRDNKDSTNAQIANAYDAMNTGLTRIYNNTSYAALLLVPGLNADANLSFANLTNPTTYSGLDATQVAAAVVAVPTTTAAAQVDITPAGWTQALDTARELSTIRALAQRLQAASNVAAAQYQLAVDYDMSSGSQMDWNRYIIGATAVEQARQTKDAQAAADAAKAGAATAANTAKALINQAMAVAQDAAAEAVANAQTTAYNNLAAAYATAVADFWDGVAAEIATW